MTGGLTPHASAQVRNSRGYSRNSRAHVLTFGPPFKGADA